MGSQERDQRGHWSVGSVNFFCWNMDFFGWGLLDFFHVTYMDFRWTGVRERDRAWERRSSVRENSKRPALHAWNTVSIILHKYDISKMMKILEFRKYDRFHFDLQNRSIHMTEPKNGETSRFYCQLILRRWSPNLFHN